jgi:hypothetical protein
MDKVIELVAVAIVVALFSSAVFELFKERFLKLRLFAKIVALLGLGLLAVVLVLLEQHIPRVESLELTVSIPVISFSKLDIEHVQITTREPVWQAIVFGLALGLISIVHGLYAAKQFRKEKLKINDNFEVDYKSYGAALGASYRRSPLVMYPIIGLLNRYIGNVHDHSEANIILTCVAISFGLVCTMIAWPGLNTLMRKLFFSFVALLFTGSIMLSAMF